ncbi:SHOCT domain-containing protein [Litorilituus sediminis]|nr:SHOCT domain-containing protein [Litorilituus sediminis]
MKFIPLIFGLLLVACTTQISSLKQDGVTQIYKLGEQEMFRIVYGVMNSTGKDLVVNEVQGVERGYEVINTFGPDYLKTTVRIIPAEGVDIDGNVIKGYYYSIVERGNNPLLSTNIIENIKVELDKTNSLTTLFDFRKGVYEFDRDGTRLNKAPSTRQSNQNIESRLQKISELYKDGIITQSEYKEKRKEILSEL